MAIRLQLVGIDLKKLKSIFGCKDPKVAEDLKKLYDERFGADIYLDDDKERIFEMHSLIDSLVMGKITPAEAEENNLFPFCWRMYLSGTTRI